MIARLLFGAGAIHVTQGRPFVLAGGWASPVYVDVRLLIGDPRGRREVTELARRKLVSLRLDNAFDAIVGAETAGMPFASWLADGMGLPLRYVRKRPLGVGRGAQVEGGSVDGLQVLLVDDLTTDGASKIGFVQGLRAAGAQIEHVLSIFDHNVFPHTGPRLAAASLQLTSLATWRDVLSLDTSEFLPAQDRVQIARFVEDPVRWSLQHGGRGEEPTPIQSKLEERPCWISVATVASCLFRSARTARRRPMFPWIAQAKFEKAATEARPLG